ncbi:MAG: response regulator transcription factor [Kiritimatiellae bacterium]|nr:response regulator transcription factor [Kiritimatiellia bacterium]
MTIRLLIADDHKLMRDGLRAMIEKEPDMEVVGEAEDGQTTVRLAKQANPHLIVMDVSMPDLNGIDATRKILAANPNVKVVALSGHANQHFVRDMLASGASAYILKHTAYDELLRAIRTVMKGKKYLSPEVARGVMDAYVELSKPSGGKQAFVVLTEREREVLQMTAEGKSTKEVSSDLGVSIKTIETHRHNIMEKLDLHSVAELTKYAIREGLTSVDR